MKGYIHSLQSMGTVDGPGVRAVVFSSGCPLRCIYCHNPDTHIMNDGELTDSHELADRIKRLIPYIKDGGVTFSGGEPCMQASFFSSLAGELKDAGLHVALDTSGCIMNRDVRELLTLTDLVLLDIKFTTDEDYKRYTGGTLSATLEFLSYCESESIPVWIRHVVVPGMNDTEEDIARLRELTCGYTCIEKTELLPFRKLCLEKYEALGIDFPLKDTPEMDERRLEELSLILKNNKAK